MVFNTYIQLFRGNNDSIYQGNVHMYRVIFEFANFSLRILKFSPPRAAYWKQMFPILSWLADISVWINDQP